MGHRLARYLTLGFFLGLLPFAPLGAEVYPLNDLGGGLHDTVPGMSVGDNEAVSLCNMQISPLSHAPEQRRGSQKTNTTQLSGKKAVDLFTFTKNNGNVYILAVASRTIYYSSDNGQMFTALITTVTDGSVFDGASGPDDRFYLVNQDDGGFYFNGTLIDQSTQIPHGKYVERYQNRLWVANTSANPNRLFFSNLLLPSTFSALDYIDFPETISGIGHAFDGGLPIYTKNGTWMLRGSDPSNFYLQQISDVIGCTDNRTIQNMIINGQQLQVFLSKGQSGSENELFGLNGVGLIRLGDKVLATLSGASAFDTSLRQLTWDSGTEFGQGSSSNVSTTAVVGSVVLSTNNTNLNNNSFESGAGIDADNWTENPTVGAVAVFRSNIGVSAPDGSYVITLGSTTGLAADYLNVLDASGNYLSTYTFTTLSVAAFNAFTQSLSDFSGLTIQIQLKTVSSGAAGTAISDPFLCSGQNLTFSAGIALAGSGGAFERFEADNFTGGRSTIGNGTYTSEIRDGGQVTMAWGTFNASSSGAGSIAYSYRTGFSTTAVAAAAWTSISPANLIAGTSEYIQWKADISSATIETARTSLDKVFITYTQTSGVSQPLASTVWKGEYWLSYTSTGAARNQNVLVMNRDLAFSTFTGLNVYGFTASASSLFGGDSATDTVSGGYVRQLDVGTTDDGVSVAASVTFKHLSLGLDDWDKNLSLVYLNYAVDSGTAAASISTNFGQKTSTYTLRMSSGTVFGRKKIEVNQQTTGKWFALTLANSYPGSRLKVYAPITYYYDKVRMVTP